MTVQRLHRHDVRAPWTTHLIIDIAARDSGGEEGKRALRHVARPRVAHARVAQARDAALHDVLAPRAVCGSHHNRHQTGLAFEFLKANLSSQKKQITSHQINQ